jgi:hypothetical protein
MIIMYDEDIILIFSLSNAVNIFIILIYKCRDLPGALYQSLNSEFYVGEQILKTVVFGR